MYSAFKVFSILTLQDKHQCIILGIAIVFGALLETIGVAAILPLLSIMEDTDYLIHHESLMYYLKMIGIVTHSQFVIFVALGLLVLYILKNVYLVWLTKWQVDFSLNLQVDYARQLYANYLLKPYIYYLDHNTATVLRNTYDGPISVFSMILISSLMLLTEVFTAILILLMLIFVDAFATLAVGVSIGLVVYGVLKVFHRDISRQGAIQSRYSSSMYQWVNQGLGAIKETKVLGREYHFFSAYGKAYEKYGDANRKFRFLNQLPRFMIETMVVGGFLILVMGKLYLGDMPSDIVPLLGVLAMAAFRLMPCANRFVNLSNTIEFNMPLFDELYDELLLIGERRTNGNEHLVFPVSMGKMDFAREICVDRLFYHYPEGQRDVLQDVSFIIPKGSFVGIVGESGAGKTTFVDLLLGLLIPTDGNIFVDGVSIYNDIQKWQRNLAYVPQEIYLIDGTIRENIALGFSSEQIDDKRVLKALHMAELFDFVLNLPNGIHTVIGERGVKLSGGQRQRIGIARALYTLPEVLVLDEATSALDDATEMSITDTILKMKGQITIIAIAHRVSTLADCDFKVRFKEGNIEVW